MDIATGVLVSLRTGCCLLVGHQVDGELVRVARVNGMVLEDKPELSIPSGIGQVVGDNLDTATILANLGQLGLGGVVGVNLVGQQRVEPFHRLLGMPCQRVAIDVHSGIGSSLDVGLNGAKIHVSFIIDTRAHLHGVASHGLGEVDIGNNISGSLIGVIGRIGAHTQLEIGVFRQIDILFQSLVFRQIGVFLGLVGTAHLEVSVKLVGTRNHQHGSKC